jgi:hypothetical protein
LMFFFSGRSPFARVTILIEMENAIKDFSIVQSENENSHVAFGARG